MKGDFSRLTFDPTQHFTRVLMQQGRVQLDADCNEQRAIVWGYLRLLARDLFGPHGGAEDAGFEISDVKLDDKKLDFKIGKGRYWVEGIPCENDQEDLTFRTQPGFPFPGHPDSPEDERYGADSFIYLEVWERYVSYLDQGHASIREVALGGPDTAGRAKLQWRVGVSPKGQGFDKLGRDELELPRLTAGLTSASASQDPCVQSPESRYRGPENQLYRVEVHSGGPAGTATFKWSRENGSVVFPVRSSKGERLVLEHLGRDSRLSLSHGDWVEVFDERSVLEERAEKLLRVEDVDRVNLEVTLSGAPQGIDEGSRSCQVRRWDQRLRKESAGGFKMSDGAGVIEEGRRLVLEDGIEIEFKGPEKGGKYAVPRLYRRGDYWLIPARTATGDIEWPPPGQPDPCPPLGVRRFRAPLAKISLAKGGKPSASDARRRLRHVELGKGP